MKKSFVSVIPVVLLIAVGTGVAFADPPTSPNTWLHFNGTAANAVTVTGGEQVSSLIQAMLYSESEGHYKVFVTTALAMSSCYIREFNVATGDWEPTWTPINNCQELLNGTVTLTNSSIGFYGGYQIKFMLQTTAAGTFPVDVKLDGTTFFGDPISPIEFGGTITATMLLNQKLYLPLVSK